MSTKNEWGFVLLSGNDDPEQRAIKRLKLASDMSLKYYGTPLVITSSGGKDSSVCVELAKRSGIPFEVQHNHTTADAPETVRFVRSEFSRLEDAGIKCTINWPVYRGKRTSMWDLIPQKMLPTTRVMRYCCKVLKENGGNDRFIATGVRWAESVRRTQTRGIFEKQVSDKDRAVRTKKDTDSLGQLFAPCKLKAKRLVNPIIDWSDDDVFSFLDDANIPLNPLYECGFKRVGCIGCPMAGKHRYKQFRRWPAYEKLYIRAFDRMLEQMHQKGKRTAWQTGIDVFRWWMEEDVLPGQMTWEDFAP